MIHSLLSLYEFSPSLSLSYTLSDVNDSFIAVFVWILSISHSLSLSLTLMIHSLPSLYEFSLSLTLIYVGLYGIELLKKNY